MRKIIATLLFCHLIFSQELTLEQANKLASLPLKCIQKDYPNKLNQVLNDSTEYGTPKELHPAFYGCFDWHSAVHGHWSLVFLLEAYPNMSKKQIIIKMLIENMTEANIINEIGYFNRTSEKSFERTYGWVWLLKLQHALDKSQHPEIKALSPILQPLTNLIIVRYHDFLPKLIYPIRAGTHQNTAFGLNFAFDYALYSKDENFKTLIEETALRLYKNDQNCPLNWEPSGTDFLSPCLEELSLMERVLAKDDFVKWLKKFIPNLLNKNFNWEVAKVSDRADGHLVHLDGLNFSRAWNFYRLAKKHPEILGHLEEVANLHLTFSLPSITDGNYEGEHWLASFVLHAFEVKK